MQCRDLTTIKAQREEMTAMLRPLGSTQPQPCISPGSLPRACSRCGPALHDKVVFVAQQGNSGGQGGYMSIIHPPAVREGYWFSCVKMHCYTASPLQLAE